MSTVAAVREFTLDNVVVTYAAGGVATTQPEGPVKHATATTTVTT
jgi:hypothetical protein